MNYKLADQIIRIESLNPRVHELLNNYRCDEPEEFVLAATDEEIKAERERSEEKSYTDAYYETLESLK